MATAKILIINSRHLSADTAGLLAGTKNLPGITAAAWPGKDSYLVGIDADAAIRFQDGLREDVPDLMDCVLAAIKAGADGICLKPDAPVMDGLPVYDPHGRIGKAYLYMAGKRTIGEGSTRYSLLVQRFLDDEAEAIRLMADGRNFLTRRVAEGTWEEYDAETGTWGPAWRPDTSNDRT